MPPRNKVKNGYEASLYDFSFTEPILSAQGQCCVGFFFFFLFFSANTHAQYLT